MQALCICDFKKCCFTALYRIGECIYILCTFTYTAIYVHVEPPDTKTVKTDIVSEGMKFEATLITGSSSLRCFIVVQGNKTTSDQYYALPRDEDSHIVSAVIPLAPADTPYTIIVYDLQQKGLPKSMAAVIDEVPQFHSSGICI